MLIVDVCVFLVFYGRGGQQTDNCHEFDYKNKLIIVLWLTIWVTWLKCSKSYRVYVNCSLKLIEYLK